MPLEVFMAAIQQWRAQHPDLEAAYVASIPRHVAESMAVEGEPVDVSFLEANLSHV